MYVHMAGQGSQDTLGTLGLEGGVRVDTAANSLSCTFGGPPSTRWRIWAHVLSAEDRASMRRSGATDAQRLVQRERGNSSEWLKCAQTH